MTGTPIRLLLATAGLSILLSCSSSGDSQSDSAAASAPANDASTLAGSAPDETGRVDSLYRMEPGPALITPDGWGPLRIGMTKAEVVAAAGEDANPAAVGGPNPEECDEFRPREAPDGVLLMLENGVLTRISISRNRDIASPAGIHIGDAASRVTEEYGARAIEQPHKYSEAPARYLTVWREAADSPDRRGIRYEIDMDGEVAHIRAGGASIEYVEGCL